MSLFSCCCQGSLSLILKYFSCLGSLDVSYLVFGGTSWAQTSAYFPILGKFSTIISFKKIIIGIQLIYNVVLASGVQQNDSVIHIHMSPPPFFKILFPYKPLQGIEQSSLCYTAGFYQLFILYIVLCSQSQSPNLSLHRFIPW